MTTTLTTAQVADFIANADTEDLLAAMVVASSELLDRLSSPVFSATGGPDLADPLAILKADEKFIASVAEAGKAWVGDQSGETLDGPDGDLHLGWAMQETVGQWLTEGRYPDGVQVNDITADAAHEYAIQGHGPAALGREVRSLLTQEN